MTLVILTHMWPWESFSRPIFLTLQLTWILMDGFFVISGFLITGILLDARNKGNYYGKFYGRRALRILPIYYATLLFILIPAALHGHDSFKETLAHWGSPWWFFAFLGNIPTAIAGCFPLMAGGALQPLWSLQVEEQFYLLFPLLIHKLKLQTLARIMFGLAFASVALRLVLYWLYPGNELVQYVLFPCRMEGLAIGAWIAIRFRQGPWQVNNGRLIISSIGWSAITLAVAIWDGCFVTGALNRTIGFLLASIAFGHIMFAMIHFRGSPQTAWLRNPVVLYVGKISYAAYLLHWPMANTLTGITTKFHLQSIDSGLPRLILIYVLTFGVSALSWHFFEGPIMKLKDRLWPTSPKSVLQTVS